MRKADNYITKNGTGKRWVSLLLLFLFFLLIDAVILWSFYSFSRDTGGNLVLRLGQWISNIFTTPLCHIKTAFPYILRHIWKLGICNAFGIIILLLSRTNHGNYRDIEAGSAHWAFRKEKKLFACRENNQPLAEGIYMTKKADLPNGNVIVVANPGDGKSFRILTPGIIQACREGYDKQSMILTDTKGALYRDTCKLVEDSGMFVRVLNLTDPKYSNLYNPLCNIHKERLHTELASLVKCYIKNSRDVDTNAGDAFWEEAFYFLLMSVWAYQADFDTNPLTGEKETRAMYRTLELIRSLKLDANGNIASDCEFANIISGVRTEKPLHLAVTNFDSLIRAAVETIQSVVITAVAKLSTFGEPDIEMLTMDDEMQIDKLCEEPTALYLNFEVGSSYKVIAAMFLEQCFASIYYIADTKYGGSLPVKCKMFLDEIANICRFNSLPERLSTARSYNIDVTLCLQALQQLKKLYEGNDQTIINNCAVFAYLGCGEPDTLERVSKMLGKTTIDEVNESRSSSGNQGRNESDRATGRELMTQDELFTLPRDKCVLIIRGHNPIFACKCKTEEWDEYELLGGFGCPENNTDVKKRYAALYSRHREAYKKAFAEREARLLRKDG